MHTAALNCSIICVQQMSLDVKEAFPRRYIHPRKLATFFWRVLLWYTLTFALAYVAPKSATAVSDTSKQEGYERTVKHALL